ncbi:tyrosinase [Geodermatophilus pulveris]|uniref:Tyrosinase n=1 Tax=Geodermatophilus pulveris TaxID=1564159 RepID=A0A239C589_9ACTN|nr:tyrosinase family protein [Geodermatophilus pulveris]SNS14584.1 tyrosinase [Geodermatophilus pulveris]
MAISLRLSVNGAEDGAGRYLTWSPRPASLAVVDADGARGPVEVRLTGPTAGDGGRLDLRPGGSDPPSGHLDLALDPDGTPVPFWLSGRFGFPSREDGDAPLEVRARGTDPRALASFPLMVRIRKDADTLTDGERSRLLLALARLNDQGRGAFRAFRDTHRESTRAEAHGRDGFPPWHRAFVLDLERALQQIDPGVTLPYWRFDVPAPRLFDETYLGAPDPPSRLPRFAASNPLRVWSTDGQPGIVRAPFFDPRRSGAHDRNGQAVRREAVVTGFPEGFTRWRGPTEVDPHGSAHVSFTGHVRVIDTAARDPLFFLLHCNVDRLWAKWQWLHRRFDPDEADTYRFAGEAGDPGSTRVGHNLADSMWPWNGVRTAPRPPTAPRMPFPPSPVTGTPGDAPTVRSMIDYQGVHDAGAWLGFDYDDVPYEP